MNLYLVLKNFILFYLNKSFFNDFLWFKSGNKIKKIEGLNSLPYLRCLDLSSNNIRSINGIPEKLEFLDKLFLQDNKVREFFFHLFGGVIFFYPFKSERKIEKKLEKYISIF